MRYLKDFSENANPLFELTKKENRFKWTLECERMFNKMKENLVQAPILAWIQEDIVLIVTCDASQKAIGGVLAQMEGEQEQPISFCSKKLSKLESALSSFEKELISVVYAVCSAFR